MNRSLNKVVDSSWIWALAPFIIVAFFLDDLGLPYTVKVESIQVLQHDQVVYCDLNGDGTTELIHAKPGEPLNNIPVMTNDGKYFDQWNLPDQFEEGLSDLHFGDYDEDRLAEIYVFTMKHDSVFLNVNELFDSAGLHAEGIYITKVNLVDGQNNSSIKTIGFFDENGDGKKEFYFAITTGFGLIPRNCFFIDFERNRVIRSPDTGINFNEPRFIQLPRGEPDPKIITSTTSPGNHTDPGPFTDYSAWLMVLDARFKFLFPPVEFKGFGGSLDVYPIEIEGQTNLVAIYNFRGTDESSHKPGLFLFSGDGAMLLQRSFHDLNLESARACMLNAGNGGKLVLLQNPLLVLNDELNVVESIPLPFETEYYAHALDFEQHGFDEIFLYSHEEQKLVVMDKYFKILAIANVDISSHEWRASIRVDENGDRRLSIKSENKYLLLDVHRDVLSTFKPLVYPVVYVGFVLLIWLTRKLSTYQVEKRQALNQRLLTLQLRSIKSQLDPHFTFNALNTISSLLYLDDRKSAYDALNIFTRLLRQLLNDADQVFRTLREEIEFVDRYLELEKIRFGNRLSFTIKRGAGVTGNELVPKLVLQIFAENAIKHGLLPKAESGEITIQIHRLEQDLQIVIQDNGIGRAKAMQNGRPGKGLKINAEFYDIINQMNPRPVRQTIIDLFDGDGNSSGTRVEVLVPYDLGRNLSDVDPVTVGRGA